MIRRSTRRGVPGCEVLSYLTYSGVIFHCTVACVSILNGPTEKGQGMVFVPVSALRLDGSGRSLISS